MAYLIFRYSCGRADSPISKLFISSARMMAMAPNRIPMATVPIPSQMQGLDLSHVLKGQEGSVPDSAFIMRVDPGNLADDDKLENWWGVRTLNHTYARMVIGGQVAPWVLYDNPNDPYQINNLINDPGYSGVQAELDGLVGDWMIRVNPHGLYMPVIGRRAG